MTASSPSKRPPCSAHGLATGPDGLCALCRREAAAKLSTPLPVAVAGDGLRSGIVTRLLGIGLLLSIAFAGAYAFDAWSSITAEPNAVVAEPARGLSPRQAAKPKPLEPAGGRAGGAQDPNEQANARPEDAVLTAEAIERKRLSDLETAEQDRRRSAQIEADIAARARKRARSNVSITMYSTSWCPSCKAARKYMTDEGIVFVEHDIDQSTSARTIMQRLNPDGSVPTIDIDGEILVGFSSAAIEDTIDYAVQKRSGG